MSWLVLGILAGALVVALGLIVWALLTGGPGPDLNPPPAQLPRHAAPEEGATTRLQPPPMTAGGQAFPDLPWQEWKREPW